jgi:hypothetical protein
MAHDLPESASARHVRTLRVCKFSQRQESHVAAQRIVLTSPWKLGLFVFVLVAGTGFGLIYAYLEVFGGEIDLSDEATLRSAYMVLGGVALLGLLGYIAVVSSARPLDRVVRNSRSREQLLKKFGKIQDPRMINIDDYEDEPALRIVLERWAEQAGLASDARLNNASQNEALAQLTTQIRESAAENFHPELEESTPDLDALVDAIKGFATTAITEQSAAHSPVSMSIPVMPVADENWEEERSTWHAAAGQLFHCEHELEGFVSSVAEHASEIASRTGNLSQHSGTFPRDVAMALEDLRRNGNRMGKIREASELLAEEVNKQAMALGLQLSRSGESASEFTDVTDGLRTLSKQYQRITAEAEIAENEQAEAVDKVIAMEVATLDSTAANALAQQAMALDQHAEALGELLRSFRAPMRQIRGLAPGIASDASQPRQQPKIQPEPKNQPEPVQAQAPDTDDSTRNFGMAGDPTPEASEDGDRVYEMAELGGRELEAEAQAGDHVYDLDEFGAIEL